MGKVLDYKKPVFLPVLRELVRTVQTFEKHSARHVQLLGYTVPQFDIVCTLGNTDGLTFKELGEKTLITKGTLTGVVDRLEGKGIVVRRDAAGDARKTIVALTTLGETEFARVFPIHLEHIKGAFDQLCPETLERLGRDANALRVSFDHIVLKSHKAR